MQNEPSNSPTPSPAPGAAPALPTNPRGLLALGLVMLVLAMAVIQVTGYWRRAANAASKRGDRPDRSTQIIATFTAMRDAIPASEPVAFWTRLPVNQDPDPAVQGMYYLAQRGFAPRVLQPETNQRWVLLVGVTPQSLPELLSVRQARAVTIVPPNVALAERQP